MISDEIIEKVKAAYPGRRLRLLSTGKGDVIVRPPSDIEVARMQSAPSDPAHRMNAVRRLVTECAVYPSREDVAKLFTEYPMLPIALLDDVLELSGMVADVEKKDL